MPQCVIRVLHRKWCPLWALPGCTGGVGRHDVAREGSHREPVRGDVMGDERQYVLGLAHPQDPNSDRNGSGHIESGGHEVPQCLLDRALVDVLDGDGHAGLRGTEHHLVASSVDLRVHGAQNLVPRQHVVHGADECIDIDVSGQPNRHRDVVHGGRRIELAQEPHALLRHRQRHRVRSLSSRQCPARTGAHLGLDRTCERLHRRRLEDRADRHLGVERRPQPGDHLGSDQRVAAECEEVVVQADALHREHLGEDCRNGLFHRVGRGAELGCLELRFGERLSIQLAVDASRKSLQHDEGRWDHVRRQTLGECSADAVLIERNAAGRYEVGHQSSPGSRVRERYDGDVSDLVERSESGVDIAEFDTETANLHLEVGTPDVLQFTVGPPGHEIAGAVQAAAGGERVGNETLRAQIGPSEVPVGELSTREIELTCDADRHRSQTRVQHVDTGVPFGPADGNRGAVDARHPMRGHRDRCLGRSVQIVQSRSGTA